MARPTVGYDLSTKKVRSLKRHDDVNGEISPEELRGAAQLEVTDDPPRSQRPTSSSSRCPRR
jgi:UDP-N-acetyl-D-galactosamine dehydrogenase